MRFGEFSGEKKKNKDIQSPIVCISAFKAIQRLNESDEQAVSYIAGQKF